MAVETSFTVARSALGGETHNTLRLRRAELVIDDSVLGLIVNTDLNLTYADGTTEALNNDARGIVNVATSRGEWVDVEFETELGMDCLRCYVVLADPATEKGAWQRLVNLGYVDEKQPGPEADSQDVLEMLLEEFQANHDIEPTGNLDDVTATALEEGELLETLWNERAYPEGSEEEDAEFGDDPKSTKT